MVSMKLMSLKGSMENSPAKQSIPEVEFHSIILITLTSSSIQHKKLPFICHPTLERNYEAAKKKKFLLFFLRKKCDHYFVLF